MRMGDTNTGDDPMNTRYLERVGAAMLLLLLATDILLYIY